MIERGVIWWAQLSRPEGSEPAKRRPVLIVSADRFNDSALQTVVVAVITSNTALVVHPGNVFLPASSTGLPKDSIVNVTSLATVNRAKLLNEVGSVPPVLLDEIDRGLRLSLDL